MRATEAEVAFWAALVRANEIAEAARNLIAQLDLVLPDWRADTLPPSDRNDTVNDAWLRLVAALEREVAP